MEFGLSQEQVLLQDSINRYLKDQANLDVVRKFTAGEIDDKSLWAGLADLGVAGLIIPEEHGGVGLGNMDAVIVAECLGYHVTPGAFLSSTVMAPSVLLAAGHTEPLAEIASGNLRIGIAFSEAIGAREKAGVSLRQSHISGKCLFVLDADADAYLIATPEQAIYLVQAEAAGLKRNRLTTIDKTQTICELILDEVKSELISTDRNIYLGALEAGRVMQAADTLGAAQCMLDQAVSYAKQREQFNRVIASFQAVKHMCAEMAAHLEPCRSMVWYAGHALQAELEDANLLACHAKAHLAEVGQFVAKTATEVHGGMGFTDLVGLHYWFKRIGFNRQLLGSPDQLREDAARIQSLV